MKRFVLLAIVLWVALAAGYAAAQPPVFYYQGDVVVQVPTPAPASTGVRVVVAPQPYPPPIDYQYVYPAPVPREELWIAHRHYGGPRLVWVPPSWHYRRLR